MASTRLKHLLITLLALGAFGVLLASAPGAMRSDKIGEDLCETTGGGEFVPIPGFPGERIDRRLLADVKYLVRKYDIFITDGYSRDPVHAANGEHPLGLALDIVPNTSKGGSWKEISALANRAEPRQDRPVAPFRWVGYNGDSGHGRGHHLHLSWNHSDTRPGHPAKTVYTLRCPGAQPKGDGGKKGGDGKNGDGGGNGGGLHPDGGSRGDDGGGIRPRAAAGGPVIETGGVDGP